MRVLFIGGTGIISSACAERAAREGLELTFRESTDTARIVTDRRIARLRDFVTGRELVDQPSGDRMVFDTFVRPGTYSVFGVIE
jgi:hypothetical protein